MGAAQPVFNEALLESVVQPQLQLLQPEIVTAVRQPVVLLQPLLMEADAAAAPSLSAAQLAAAATLAARRDEVTAAGSFEATGEDSVEQRSEAELFTPPASPTSPASVLPSSTASRRSPNLYLHELPAATFNVCSPESLLRPLQLAATPTRPPGFDITASQTRYDTPARSVTPARSITPRRSVSPARLDTPARSVTPTSPPGFGGSRKTAVGALFVQAQVAILLDPVVDPKPAAQKNRRKTLALGFTATRSSLRLKSSSRGVPVAKLAQRNLLRKLGIIDDGDDVS
jgi:hypothetical protein